MNKQTNTWKYPQNLQNSNIELSTTWLKIETLFPETEGFVATIQDGVFATKNYRSTMTSVECVERQRK